MGLRLSMCLIAPTEQSAAEVRATLADGRFDLISIGNGVHAIPSFLPTFETVMNDVHRLAQGSWLCFATGPDTVYDSVVRSEEHTSELQSLMRISYAVFCLKKKKPYNEV